MKTRIITVSREFGSGGRTVGRLVAEKLGFAFYDNELVQKSVEKSGYSEDFVENSGEYAKASNFFSYNLTSGESFSYGGTALSPADRLFIIQSKIIKELAAQSPCVIVGRCADYILADRNDCLHTFIHADMDHRAERIVKVYGERDDGPVKRLLKKDKMRKTYYKHYTDRQWGAAKNYDVSLDSGTLGIEACADVIVDLVNAMNDDKK